MSKNKSERRVWHELQSYILVALGLLIFSMSWQIFLIPNKIVGGGASGIASMIYLATNGVIPISATIIVMNLLLLLFAIKPLGWNFFFKTVFGVVALSCWFMIPVMHMDFFQPLIEFGGEDLFMASILGAIFSGIGMGLVFMNNGSSGGIDIIAKIINKHRDISLGRALMFCDLLIISSSYFLPENNIRNVIYGLMVMVVMTNVVDVAINSQRQSVQFFIFSKKYKEIADRINNEARRGVTVLEGLGWHSQEPCKVLTVMVRKQESSEIFQLIKEEDPDAFITQSAVMGVYGNGFDSKR
ncbi:MAG: YitT family protein [Paludibacteraceae bacterium]|nr:YitT family protein [Paludibacteraceae bacterium]